MKNPLVSIPIRVSRFRPFGKPKRSGAIVVEMLLVSPILLAFLLGITQFGLILANLKHVELGAFSGAKVASMTDPLQSEADIEDLVAQVNRTLQTGRLPHACRIDVDHNWNGGTLYRISHVSENGNDCPEPPQGELPLVDDLNAVRVIVTVRLSQLAPDLLTMFGLSLETRFTRASVVLPQLQAEP